MALKIGSRARFESRSGCLEANFSDDFSRFPAPNGHGQLWFLKAQSGHLASGSQPGACIAKVNCGLAKGRERPVLSVE